jgi:hypothetical protein
LSLAAVTEVLMEHYRYKIGMECYRRPIACYLLGDTAKVVELLELGMRQLPSDVHYPEFAAELTRRMNKNKNEMV